MLTEMLPAECESCVGVDAGLGIVPRAVIAAAVGELAHPVASVGCIKCIEDVVYLAAQCYMRALVRQGQFVLQVKVGHGVSRQYCLGGHGVVQILAADY